MIRVVLLSEFEDEDMDVVLSGLRKVYGVGAEIGRRTTLPSEAYDPKADAYDALATIAEAQAVRTFGNDKILFLCDRPLSLPVGPMGAGPVDGFAHFTDVKGIATSAGLEELDGEGKFTLADGLAKRAVRQVGHLFGLHHCHDARCSMLPGWLEGFHQNSDAVLCTFCRDKSESIIEQG